ncbi:MAG: hypothetical protein H0U49_03385 [Parachlamydiaceae bacterium]|nr:hypothetical protein [Parachlamydiaceae bacterium]
MSIVDSLHSGRTPDWRIDPQSTITERELVDLEKKFEVEAGKRDFEARFRDSMSPAASALPANTSASRAAKDKKLYRSDSMSKAPAAMPAMGMVNLFPTSGVHKIAKPQDVAAPPAKSVQAVPNLVTTKASVEGFVNTVKNFFWNVFGWGSPPAGDVTGETPLTGSPKEQVFSERDLQAMAKALDQMNIAINQLITKSSEQSKEMDSEDGDKEAEIIQLKQMLSELQILKKIISAIKGSVTGNELQTIIAAEGITKNYQVNKGIQKVHLENAENIDTSLQRAEWMIFINYGAAGVSGLAIILSLGAAAATAATGGAAAPILAGIITTTKVVVGVMGTVASFTSAGATTVKILEEQKAGVKQAENEGFNNIKQMLQEEFKNLTKEEERQINAAVRHQKELIELAGNKSQLIKSAAYQMSN